jgi:hypothetical protein
VAQKSSTNRKTTYNYISNNLKCKIKEERDRSFTDSITSLNRFDNTIWKPIKYLKKNKTQIHPIRNEMAPQPVWARSDEEKAAMFAEHLATVYILHDDLNDNEKERQLPEKSSIIPELKYLTVKEVQNETPCLNPKKSPGIDGVTLIMLKEMSTKILVLLTYIFNPILKQKYWLGQLKAAEIIMIPKPGKSPNNVSSYLPMSLLPIISKLLEKLLLKN